jgi:hypothetical protein
MQVVRECSSNFVILEFVTVIYRLLHLIDIKFWEFSLFQLSSVLPRDIFMLSFSIGLLVAVVRIELGYFWIKRKRYPCNRPWRPIELWDVEVPTFFRKSAHRWRWVYQPYAPAALFPPGRFLLLISVRGWVDPRAIVRPEGVGQLKNPMTSSGFEPATFRFVA